MTLAEQRAELVKLLDTILAKQGERFLAAISAAGFSIIGPEVTEEMDAAGAKSIEQIGDADTLVAGIFLAMARAGDLARKPNGWGTSDWTAVYPPGGGNKE